MRNLRMSRSVKGFETDNETKDIWRKQGKPIVAVDFDGTLVKNKYPYCENPNLELIDFIKEHESDYLWILWTCRHDVQLQLAVEYLHREHGITFDLVNENAPWLIEQWGDTRKVRADFYIDDNNADLSMLKKKGEI